MIFRPQLWPTLAMLPVLVLLIGLGQWQLHRLEWKRGLIAAAEGRSAASPAPLSAVLALPEAEWNYRPATATGRFDHGREVYLFANPGSGRAPGYFVITPLRRKNGPPVLVNRGYVPGAKRDPATRASGQVMDDVTVTGLLRIASEPGLFTPAPDKQGRIWYARDVAAMARAAGLRDAAPVLLDADATPNPGGWPEGGLTRLHFTNRHLGYALTWFGLALVLVVIYAAYHRARGRLAWRR